MDNADPLKLSSSGIGRVFPAQSAKTPDTTPKTSQQAYPNQFTELLKKIEQNVSPEQIQKNIDEACASGKLDEHQAQILIGLLSTTEYFLENSLPYLTEQELENIGELLQDVFKEFSIQIGDMFIHGFSETIGIENNLSAINTGIVHLDGHNTTNEINFSGTAEKSTITSQNGQLYNLNILGNAGSHFFRLRSEQTEANDEGSLLFNDFETSGEFAGWNWQTKAKEVKVENNQQDTEVFSATAQDASLTLDNTNSRQHAQATANNIYIEGKNKEEFSLTGSHLQAQGEIDVLRAEIISETFSVEQNGNNLSVETNKLTGRGTYNDLNFTAAAERGEFQKDGENNSSALRNIQADLRYQQATAHTDIDNVNWQQNSSGITGQAENMSASGSFQNTNSNIWAEKITFSREQDVYRGAGQNIDAQAAGEGWQSQIESADLSVYKDTYIKQADAQNTLARINTGWFNAVTNIEYLNYRESAAGINVMLTGLQSQIEGHALGFQNFTFQQGQYGTSGAVDNLWFRSIPAWQVEGVMQSLNFDYTPNTQHLNIDGLAIRGADWGALVHNLNFQKDTEHINLSLSKLQIYYQAFGLKLDYLAAYYQNENNKLDLSADNGLISLTASTVLPQNGSQEDFLAALQELRPEDIQKIDIANAGDLLNRLTLEDYMQDRALEAVHTALDFSLQADEKNIAALMNFADDPAQGLSAVNKITNGWAQAEINDFLEGYTRFNSKLTEQIRGQNLPQHYHSLRHAGEYGQFSLQASQNLDAFSASYMYDGKFWSAGGGIAKHSPSNAPAFSTSIINFFPEYSGNILLGAGHRLARLNLNIGALTSSMTLGNDCLHSATLYGLAKTYHYAQYIPDSAKKYLDYAVIPLAGINFSSELNLPGFSFYGSYTPFLQWNGEGETFKEQLDFLNGITYIKISKIFPLSGPRRLGIGIGSAIQNTGANLELQQAQIEAWIKPDNTARSVGVGYSYNKEKEAHSITLDLTM
ncbi:MAG: hypothetical protein LBD99_03100 [Candidatus Margulisbacteria bacterium]|jgi:hypothetical protein|nr:hypothetical protein [Candidatus Margulisiibacteriota bacterium]